MANFCTNCGAKIDESDNYCGDCGTKIDKSDIKQNNHLLKSVLDNTEKASKRQEKTRITKETINAEIEEKEMRPGNYCDLNCIHCYEEFLDSSGEIEGDFTSDGNVEYYCNLGHPVYYGSFCEDYK